MKFSYKFLKFRDSINYAAILSRGIDDYIIKMSLTELQLATVNKVEVVVDMFVAGATRDARHAARRLLLVKPRRCCFSRTIYSLNYYLTALH